MQVHSMRIYPSGRRVLSQVCLTVSAPTTCGYLCRIFTRVLCPLTLFLLAVCSLSPPLFFVRLLSCVAFDGASAFNAGITHWNVGADTDMSGSKSLKKTICFFLSQYSKTSMHFLLTPFYNHFRSPCSVLQCPGLRPYPLQ